MNNLPTARIRPRNLLLPGLLLTIASWLMISTTALMGETSTEKTPTDSSTPHVTCIVDYGDGVQKHFSRLTWKREMTVSDVLDQAAGHRHGIRYEHRGQRDTLLVTQIDDLINQGGRGRNWMLRVNDQMASRSAGITEVMPGDVIRWTFEEFR